MGIAGGVDTAGQVGQRLAIGQARAADRPLDLDHAGRLCSSPTICSRSRCSRRSPVSSGWKAVASTRPWSHGDRVAVRVARQHLGPRPDLGHQRRADEDAVERLAAELRDVEIGLEAVELAAVAVAPNLEVEDAEVRGLAIGQAIGEQDHAGAGAEQWRAGRAERDDRLAEPVGIDQAAHRRRLAAGQDERVEVDEVARQAHLDRLGADVADRGHVLAHGALQGEHADPGHAMGTHRSAYQPRMASRSSGGISPNEVPRIGSPRPVLTSARISGLS